MPCNDGGPPSSYYHDSAIRDMQRRNDKLARMLCGLCRVLDNVQWGTTYIHKVPELDEWWLAHKEADRRREEADRARKAAIQNQEIDQLRKLQKKYPHLR